MFIDLTLLITPKMVTDASGNEKKSLVGHLGTHFDVMNREFPLDYVERQAIAFDVSGIEGRDIEGSDIELPNIQAGMFAAFYTGFIEREGYGSKRYFKQHPQLSQSLIDSLLKAGVSIIAIDCAGIRRGAEHTPADQSCADKNAFVVENICNLKELLQGGKSREFTAHTYPVNYAGVTGLPCRVVAEI